ncbi:MAG: RloB family protein [Solirubrobacteraceae bacterium]
MEGERTEDAYFKAWWRRNQDKVIVHIDEFNGTPMTLVERAVARKKHEEREERRERGKAHDEVWCVFDVDTHPKREEAVELAQRHDIKVAISNPCFELWLMLHYQDQTASIKVREVQKLAKSHLKCGKALSPQALDSLASRYDEAVKRAKALDKKHEGDDSPPGTNPSSEVWKLVERIRKPVDR